MEKDSVIAEKSIKKERNASLDLLRVLAMFMIVMTHCLPHTGLLESDSLYNANCFIIKTVSSFICVHVNCFVLVSGYFLCTGKFRISKWLKLWASALFWSGLIYIILCSTGNGTFTFSGFAKAFMPFTQRRYWFLSTYLLMYILTPVCNAAIHAMTQKQHLRSIIGFFSVYILLQNIFYWNQYTSVSHIDPLFFVFLYFVAAYIRKYPFQKKYPWFIGYIICMTFVSAYIIIEPMISEYFIKYGLCTPPIAYYTSVPVVLGSVCFFMMFAQMNVKGVLAKIAIAVSPLTFGVYLIHDQPEMRSFLWGNIDIIGFADSPFLILVVVGVTVAVFAACCFAEKIRLKLFEILKIDLLWVKISDLCEKVLLRLCGEKIQTDDN